MKPNVTMKDLAIELGISIVTVSKALNDKEGVGEELKQRIKQLAEERGYHIHALAKSMKEGYSYNIGVVVAERFTATTPSFYMQFYQYIAKSLDARQYSGILHILSAEDEERKVLPRMYLERKVDGFIILGQIDKAYIDALLQTDVPVVFLDFYTDQPEMDCVITDNFFGVYELTNYLIRSGHREIGFVGNPHATSSIQDRYLGYYKSLLEHRIDLSPELILYDRDDKGRFVELQLPRPEQMPTAFVCNCDQVAYNLIQTLNHYGYKVPDDCSVVGFDNDLYATISQPKLTTVEVDMAEMAKAAVKFVVKKVKNSTIRYGRVLVKGKLMHRDSVKTIR